MEGWNNNADTFPPKRFFSENVSGNEHPNVKNRTFLNSLFLQKRSQIYVDQIDKIGGMTLVKQ